MAKAILSIVAHHLRHALRSLHDKPEEHSSVIIWVKQSRKARHSPTPRATFHSVKLRDGQVVGTALEDSRYPGESVDLVWVFIIRAEGIEKEDAATYCAVPEP